MICDKQDKIKWMIFSIIVMKLVMIISINKKIIIIKKIVTMKQGPKITKLLINWLN